MNNFLETKHDLINIKIQEKTKRNCDTNVNYKIRINIIKRFFPFKLIFRKKNYQIIHEYYKEINRRLSIFSILTYHDEINVLMKRNFKGRGVDNSDGVISTNVGNAANREKNKEYSFQKKSNSSIENLS